MALRTARIKEEDPKICPRCMHELIVIDNILTKWLTCQNCKWKKLVGKEGKEIIHVTPLGGEKGDVLNEHRS